MPIMQKKKKYIKADIGVLSSSVNENVTEWWLSLAVPVLMSAWLQSEALSPKQK